MFKPFDLYRQDIIQKTKHLHTTITTIIKTQNKTKNDSSKKKVYIFMTYTDFIKGYLTNYSYSDKD